LVYVSSNMIQFGYAAEELLSGRIAFSEIVHPDDRDRLAEEVKALRKPMSKNTRSPTAW